MRGLRDSSKMEVCSAPSAKIFIRRSSALGMALGIPSLGRENPRNRFAQRPDTDERRLRLALAITVVDEYRLASGAVGGFDVAPSIANEVARCQIDFPLRCG